MGAANAEEADQIAPWHTASADEVVKRLATNRDKGLKAAEAASRLQTYGPNRLPEGKKRGPFLRFLGQFNNILVYVLLAAGFTKLMLSLWVDAAIIFAVVVLNGLLGLHPGRESREGAEIRSATCFPPRRERCAAARRGCSPAEQLVPGDVVLLESGDKIPADLRLVEAKNLHTEEAALTGELVPAEKNTDPVSEKATVGDRECMAFSGTMVVVRPRDGRRRRDGQRDRTRPHQPAACGVSPLETPLLRQIKKFGYAITAVIGVISVIDLRLRATGPAHELRRASSRRSPASPCR